MFFVVAFCLLDEFNNIVGFFGELLLKNFQSLTKIALQKWTIKHHELNGLPLFNIWIIATHNRYDTLEIIATTPELSIKRDCWQLFYPFLWSIDLVSISGKHRRSIPITSHTI